MTDDDLGLKPVEPLSPSERAELDFVRLEVSHLLRRLSETESLLKQTEANLADTEIDRDTIRHERNLMSQDLRWTLEKLASSPAGPLLRRSAGFQRMIDTWGEPPT